jgi:diguanylate cyclase (GGDEF)-like protein
VARPSTQSDQKRLTELLNVAKLVFSTLELNAAMDAILQSALALSHTTAGSIALYDEERRELALFAHRGFGDEFLGNRRWRPAPGSFSERLLAATAPVVVNRPTHPEFFREGTPVGANTKTLACVPLIFRQQPIGILYVDNFTIRTFTGHELHALAVLADFAAAAINHAKIHEATKELARTDGLTGLFNHRYFHDRMSTEIARAHRYQRPLVLMMIDVDNFKQVNDRHGHPAGDRVLKKIAAIVRESVREMDVACRYGGEEFSVILPETEIEGAVRVAERIRTQVEALTPGLIDPQTATGATVSIGIAPYATGARTADELITKSDEALYLAKSQGKNRVVVQGG